MTIEWTAPGGGEWHLETTHVRGAQPRVFQERAVRGFGAGFRAAAAGYGLPIDHVAIAFVNDHCYGRMVPVGAPEPTPGKPSAAPPAAALWLLARVHPELRRRAKAAKRALTERRWLDDCRRWVDELRPELVAASRALQAEDLSVADDVGVVDHLRRAGDLYERGMSLHFDLMPSHDVPLGRLLVACRGWGIEPAEALTLLAGHSPASRASTERLRAIADACAAAGVDPQSLDDVRRAGPAAEQALDAYLGDHGWRVVSQYSPRALALVELPHVLVQAIRTATPAPVAIDAEPLRSRVPDGDRVRFDELLADARACYFLRDDNVALTFMWPAGLVRRALLAAGARLVERDLLDDAGHVFALGEHEIAQALAGDPSFRALAAERTAQCHTAERAEPPAVLGDDEGPPPSPTLFPRAMAEIVAATFVSFELEPLSVDQSGVAWSGAGIGVGTVPATGRACVAGDAEDALDRLGVGDILVTTHTTPAYEAILPIVAAVVTQNGGLLSHAALACREHGVSAVLGVAGATEHIPDGATVTVDPIGQCVTICAEVLPTSPNRLPTTPDRSDPCPATPDSPTAAPRSA